MNQIITYPFPILSKNTFNFMSYNLGFCAGHLGLEGIVYPKSFIQDNIHRICNTVNTHSIDILCTQEIDISSRRSYYINQIDTIATQCRFPYVYISESWHKRWVPYPTTLNFKKQFGPTHAGQAIFSKFPILTASTKLFSKPKTNSFIYNFFYIDRLAQSCIFKVTDTQCLQVINCHLDAYSDATRHIQAKQMCDMVQHERVVFCGDFNSEKESIAVQTIESNTQSCDAFQDNPEVTFPSNGAYRRLDYIFSSPLVKSAHSKVITNDTISSDHFPIMTSLTLV